MSSAQRRQSPASTLVATANFPEKALFRENFRPTTPGGIFWGLGLDPQQAVADRNHCIARPVSQQEPRIATGSGEVVGLAHDALRTVVLQTKRDLGLSEIAPPPRLRQKVTLRVTKRGVF